MPISYKDKVVINGSEVYISILEDISWEELVIFRAKTSLYQRTVPGNPEGTQQYTYRSIKDWMIKGE